MTTTVAFSVGMGQAFFSADPAATFLINGLGSCIALALFDPEARVGGLCHIVLPEGEGTPHPDEPAKYANHAVPYAMRQIARLGANPRKVLAKIAGGAHLFQAAYAPLLQIGQRNIAAVEAVLSASGIRLVASDTGGKSGRSITFRLQNGEMEIRTLQGGSRTI